MVYEKSCGCVVIDDDKMLLIKQKKGYWSFPKGHVEMGESEKETAIREVYEETNVLVSITDNYRYVMTYNPNGNKNIHKDVIFFLATPINKNTIPQEEEVSEVRWVSIDDVYDLLTFDDSKKLYEDVISYLKK